MPVAHRTGSTNVASSSFHKNLRLATVASKTDYTGMKDTIGATFEPPDSHALRTVQQSDYSFLAIKGVAVSIVTIVSSKLENSRKEGVPL